MTTRTFKVQLSEEQRSSTFKLVTAPEPEALQEFIQFCSAHAQKKVDFLTYNRIGSGACGSVYAIGLDYVVKANDGWYSGDGNTRDGQILEQLQGVPMIPTIYAYSEDNRYMLIQRIKGETIDRFTDYDSRLAQTLKDTHLEFNQTEWLKQSELFYEKAFERGYAPHDLHSENVMIDSQGRLWVIDVGLFRNPTRYSRKGERMTDQHIIRVNSILTGESPDWDLVGCPADNDTQPSAYEKQRNLFNLSSTTPDSLVFDTPIENYGRTNCQCDACKFNREVEAKEPVQELTEAQKQQLQDFVQEGKPVDFLDIVRVARPQVEPP